jgi:SAM-dependent methyltransferase
MAAETAHYKVKVQEEWMDAPTAAAWRKWHGRTMIFWQELTTALIESAGLVPGQRVLDLAGGTGDPALVVAAKVAPNGHVVITDLAPQMLEIAEENARKSNLGNVSFVVADAHMLPFGDSVFDRVTCKLGVMFFWDCSRALSEIRRVMKPGGTVAFVAWGPADQNDYMRTALGPFKKRKPMPAPPADAPQPYRFCVPGSLSAELSAAGFSSVSEETRTVRSAWPGTPHEAWDRLYEAAAPMRPYFNSFAPEVRAEAVREVIEGFEKFKVGDEVMMKASIVVASAVR